MIETNVQAIKSFILECVKDCQYNEKHSKTKIDNNSKVEIKLTLKQESRIVLKIALTNDEKDVDVYGKVHYHNIDQKMVVKKLDQLFGQFISSNDDNYVWNVDYETFKNNKMLKNIEKVFRVKL